MLWEESLLNHEKVDFKLIMKQYWLLGVENDEAIMRNGYERTWKFERSKSSFHDLVCFSWWVFNESDLSIYSREMKNGRWVVENGGWAFLMRMVDGNVWHQKGNGRWETGRHRTGNGRLNWWPNVITSLGYTCESLSFFEREALMKSRG